MKKIDNKIIKIITIVLILLIVLLLVNLLTGNKIVDNIYTNIIKRLETNETIITYVVYDNQNTSKLKVIYTIENIDGIEYVKLPNATKINGNGKTRISFDYTVSIGTEIELKIKTINREEQIEKVKITQDDIDNMFELEEVEVNSAYTKLKVNDKTIIPYNQLSYTINGNTSNYSDGITIHTNMLTSEINTMNSSREISINITKKDRANNIVNISKNYTVKKVTGTVLNYQTFSELVENIQASQVYSGRAPQRVFDGSNER